MTRLENGLGKWVLKYRWWILISAILAVAVAASGIPRLTFTNDSRIYFSEENPQLQALEALENIFSKEEGVLFVLAPEDGNVFTPKTLEAIKELTEVCWQLPFAVRVDSITNFQHTRAEQDDLIVEDLVADDTNLSESDLKEIKAIALTEPVLVSRLISPTGHVAGINVMLEKPGKSLEETPIIAAAARKMAENFTENHPGIDVYLTGGLMIDNAFGEASKDDMTTLVPIMFLVLLVIMALTLRSISGTIATFFVIVFAMLTGLGFSGWLGFTLDPSSVNAPTIILTLAVADSIHILITMFYHMRQGQKKQDAIIESLKINFRPVLITSVTTAVGFLTMNFSDAPPFRTLGNTVAIGVASAFVYSIFFLPALMSVLPVKIKPRPAHEKLPCDALASFVINWRNAFFWGTLALICVLVVGVFQIQLNDDFIKYFDHRYDFRRATDFTEENLTGFNAIEYILDSGESSGINDPLFLKKAEAFTNWYREQPDVTHVNTHTDTIKRLNKNMHADDPAFYRIPDQRNLIAQYLLLYEMSLPFGLDLNNRINVDKSAIRMVVFLKNMTAISLREMDDRARGWLQKNAPELLTYGTGLSIMFAHISKRNIESMLGASFGALGLISIILIFALRSFKVGMVSLVPNLAPAFMSFGLWGILVGQVGLVISVIAAMTLGIIVDDTVHFLNKYLVARRQLQASPQEAVRYAYHTVGTALWVTTIILVAGFMVLALSGFKMNANSGLMTSITIVFALALDFLFLPTLLLQLERTDE